MTQTSTRVMSTHRSRSDSPRLRWTVIVLEALVAVNAIWAGVTMMKNPLTPLGVTTDLIAGSPFHTYTWPGILLLVLNGIVPAALAIGLVARSHGAMLLSAAWGLGFMAWIVTQWFLLSDVLWLQYVLFVVGAVVAGCAITALRHERRH